jgi:hypothetical protein
MLPGCVVTLNPLVNYGRVLFYVGDDVATESGIESTEMGFPKRIIDKKIQSSIRSGGILDATSLICVMFC